MSTEYHQYFIKNYSERLRLDGFTVHNIIEDKEQVPKINGIQPTIYARDRTLERIIIVEPEDKYNEKRDDLIQLKEYSRKNHQVSYWGFITTDKTSNLIENLI